MLACVLHFIFMSLFALILLYGCTHWRRREAEAAQTPLNASVTWRSCIFCHVAETTGRSLGLTTWLLRMEEVNTHARLQRRNIVSFSLAHRVHVHRLQCWCGNYNFIAPPALRPQMVEKRKTSFRITHKTVFIWAPRGMCTRLQAHSHFCSCVFMLYIPRGCVETNKEQ